MPTDLHLDHIEQWAAGGANTIANLRVCCASCNLRRPRSTDIRRNGTIGFERRNGTYYWTRPDYRPPKRPRGDVDCRSIDWIATHLGLTPGQVFSHIVSGSWPATGGNGPIRVQIDRLLITAGTEIEEREAVRREAEEDRRAEREHAAAERKTQERKFTRDSLDPARVEYWRQVIAEGRATRR